MKDSFFNQKSQCFYKTNLKARINLEKCKRCYKCVSRCPQNRVCSEQYKTKDLSSLGRLKRLLLSE